jgi:hypothetical protein
VFNNALSSAVDCDGKVFVTVVTVVLVTVAALLNASMADCLAAARLASSASTNSLASGAVIGGVGKELVTVLVVPSGLILLNVFAIMIFIILLHLNTLYAYSVPRAIQS